MAVPDNRLLNALVIAEFRATGGHTTTVLQDRPLLLLHTTGARSGAERVNPLVYRREGGDIFVFASKAGAPKDPDWFRNLLSNPNAEIEIGADRYAVVATVVAGPKANDIWARHKAEFSNFAEYEAMTSRKIPVVALRRVDQ